MSNVENFINAIQINSRHLINNTSESPEEDIAFCDVFKNKRNNLTLRDLFEAFDEASCLGLKLEYLYQGKSMRADYLPSLSAYHFKLASNSN